MSPRPWENGLPFSSNPRGCQEHMLTGSPASKENS